MEFNDLDSNTLSRYSFTRSLSLTRLKWHAECGVVKLRVSSGFPSPAIFVLDLPSIQSNPYKILGASPLAKTVWISVSRSRTTKITEPVNIFSYMQHDWLRLVIVTDIHNMVDERGRYRWNTRTVCQYLLYSCDKSLSVTERWCEFIVIPTLESNGNT